MQRLTAISWLTLKAAYRYRLIWVLTVILLGGVVLLPLVIKDDGTARGFTQILLTYTLSLTTAVLGFATLWLACGALSREIEECQMQVVATKPVHRWEIWLGKYLGIMTLNALLLGLAGVCVYFLLQWRARGLPEDQRTVLRDEIFVARGVAHVPMPDYEAESEQIVQQRLKDNPVAPTDMGVLRNMIRAQVKAAYENVPPGAMRQWKVPLGSARNRLKDQPVYVRVKFNSAQGTGDPVPHLGLWGFGEPNSPRFHKEEMSLASETAHELRIPENLFDDEGVLSVAFVNFSESVLIFSLQDGIEVLYRDGSFGMNFARGLCIILFWLAFLAAIGLAASSFLSFPVAAFVSMGILIIGFSTGTIKLVIEQGTVGEVNHETGAADAPMILDYIALPFFKGTLALINMVKGYSPIDSLSSGRSISWLQLGSAFVQVCVVFSGLVAAGGIVAFNRRELATAQGTI